MNTVDRVKKEVKDKWEQVLRDYENLPIEKKIQRVIHIPLQDVKNILEASQGDEK